MDVEAETLKLKLLIWTAVAFLVSTFFAWQEVKYFVRGETVSATLDRAFMTQKALGRGRGRDVLEVHYSFADPDGTPRSESDQLPPDWPRPAGPTVGVQFIPGAPGVSRVQGHRSVVSLVIFFTCLTLLAGFIGKLVLEAREYGAEKRRRAAYARR